VFPLLLSPRIRRQRSRFGNLFEPVARMERSELRDFLSTDGAPDCAEPVIGRAFARPVGSIRATDYGVGFCPTGKSAETCPAPLAKIFLFCSYANQFTNFPVSFLWRGVSRSSRTRDGMRWTRTVPLTNGTEADGEVVWSCRRWCQVGGDISADDGGKRARSPGSTKETVKTIAWGMPGCFRWTRGD
jgi:hypothetical protein